MPKKPRSIEDLKTSTRRNTGCNICGEKTKGHIAVVLKDSKDNTHITSRTKSFCNDHALEMYASMTSSLVGESND